MDLTLLVDVALGLTLLEVAALLLLHARTGRGIAARDLLPNVLAGLLLMVALRLHLAGVGLAGVSASLLLAGVAHAVDLRRRWR